ncbi:MAG TPA: sigma-70 family RNA polymerase sigma factor [Acidobacteriota bacterium]|nr:sigma-70 family RNA polymerase sigma factor [Acidobacteriota bacterium]
MSDQEITLLLQAANRGEEEARERLVHRVYGELRRLAGSIMRSERSGHTLQPTALVHEAYLRLLVGEVNWQNRSHFFGAAAQAMRRILVEHARRKRALKRGAEYEHAELDDQQACARGDQLDILILDEALTALSGVDPRLTQVVELRYFAGLEVEETAEVLAVSPATVKRDWSYAKAWLCDHISSRAAKYNALRHSPRQ